jgi:hypothetical protein
MCKMEQEADSEHHVVSPVKLFVSKVQEAHVSNSLVLLQHNWEGGIHSAG